MPLNLPAQGAWNGQKGVLGTGEIRLDAGYVEDHGPPARGARQHDSDNQRTWETVKCRAEVGGGRSSDDDRNNITRSERMASSQVCEATSDYRGIASRAINPAALGGAVYEL